MSIVHQIVKAGTALQLALHQAHKINALVLKAIADSPAKRPTAAWFADFVALVNAEYAWPTDEKGAFIGYRTVMRNAGKYGKPLVASAYFFNSFQAWLYTQKLVQSVKADATGKRSSKANVVKADDVLKRLQSILMLAPQDKRDAVAKELAKVAKVGFGIVNADFSNVKRV